MKKYADFKTFKRVKQMSLNDFNRWVMELYRAAFEDGLKEGEEEWDECVAAMTEDRMLEVFMSVRGIGPVRAQRLLDAVLQEGISYKKEMSE